MSSQTGRSRSPRRSERKKSSDFDEQCRPDSKQPHFEQPSYSRREVRQSLTRRDNRSRGRYDEERRDDKRDERRVDGYRSAETRRASRSPITRRSHERIIGQSKQRTQQNRDTVSGSDGAKRRPLEDDREVKREKKEEVKEEVKEEEKVKIEEYYYIKKEEERNPNGRRYNVHHENRDEHSSADDQSGLNAHPPKPEEPNFEPSGLLAEETNTKNGVLLKYNEPTDARNPSERWRCYMFKPSDESEATKILHLYRASCFLVGKDPRVAEICLAHPSISKQHAAIQFRLHFGKVNANGTLLNGKKIEPSRYYELRHGDSLKFGRSSRDLVLLNESAAEGAELSYSEFADSDVSKQREALRVGSK